LASGWMLRGDVADARHDWTAAEAAYREALAADPQVPHGHYSLGLTLYKQRRYDEAARVFDQALAATPDYAPALRYRAELELDRGKADAALPYLLRLTVAAPRDANGWKLLGRAKLDRQQADEAAADLERARALAPEDPTVHFLLGRALSAAGRPAEAKAAFERATALNQRLREQLEQRVSGNKKDGGW
jgi:tetratricopeptide (TPR) repeat protein